MNQLPPGHTAAKFDFESTLELLPDIDVPVEVEGFAHVFVDPDYGADADGNRGQWRSEVDEVVITRIWANFPERPAILLCEKGMVDHFLSKLEYECLVDQACDRVFRDFKPGWDWED